MSRGWTFVIARTVKGRPTLMHLVNTNINATHCGVVMTGWSRAYTQQPIPQILCKKCGRAR